jgi:hypothetical protein
MEVGSNEVALGAVVSPCFGVPAHERAINTAAQTVKSAGSFTDDESMQLFYSVYG